MFHIISVRRLNKYFHITSYSAVYSGGVGCARAPPEFGGSGKGRSLISAYQSLAITTNTPGFEKLNTALSLQQGLKTYCPKIHTVVLAEALLLSKR